MKQVKDGWLTKVLKRKPAPFVRDEIETFLALKSPKDLTPARITEMFRHTRLQGDRVQEVLSSLYEQAVRSFLSDSELSASEVEYLRDLRIGLGLGIRQAEDAQERATHHHYRKAVQEVLDDSEISEAERSSLKALGDTLRISSEAREAIYGDEAKSVMTHTLNRATADSRLSPEEIATLSELSTMLGVTVTFDDATQAKLERMALLWRIENDQLPTLDVPIHLQRAEVCHASTAAEWRELRSRTVRVDYAGPSISFRICKGVRYRAGSITPQRITREELVSVDHGTLYVTSKRVIFDGQRKNSAFRYSSLIGFQAYSDGVVLEKAAGRNPLFLLGGDVELFLTILGSAMARA